MTKPPLSKNAVLVICLAPFLLSGMVLIGWIGRHFTIHLASENMELVYSLMYATVPAAVAYVVGGIFAIYHLLIGSRHPFRTLKLLCIASAVAGYMTYLAPIQVNQALPPPLEHRMLANTLSSFPTLTHPR